MASRLSVLRHWASFVGTLKVNTPVVYMADYNAQAHEAAFIHWRTKGGVRGGKLEESTLNIYRTYLKSFLDWCARAVYLSVAPVLITDAIRPFHHERYEPLFLTVAQIPRLLELADGRHPRDRALVATQLHTGARISEVWPLAWNKIDWSGNRVRIYRRKTKRETWQKLTPSARRELAAWLDWYRSNIGDPMPEWSIFPAINVRGDSRRPRDIRNIDPTFGITDDSAKFSVRKSLNLLAKEDPFWAPNGLGGQSSHILRRTAGHQILKFYQRHPELGIEPLMAACKWLDHRNTTITANYLNWSEVADHMADHFEVMDYYDPDNDRPRAHFPAPPGTALSPELVAAEMGPTAMRWPMRAADADEPKNDTDLPLALEAASVIDLAALRERREQSPAQERQRRRRMALAAPEVVM